ncbi:MAG TPA: alanine--tRNA ligase, partial [bacterium (Candidatus Stahlbacteria)]|nr:alanine--tRNA ligase [Candidatus Stahlbacteria bacterium]
FEMLGNWSFGDYFKKEAIEWAWRFLAEVLKIDRTRISVSVHTDDDEAYQIWKGIGLEPVRLGDEDNFWGPAGNTGACGPSSEIFYDLGEEFGCGRDGCGPGCDCDRFPEIWNLVFPQFNQVEGGERLPLKNRGIDTGMGLERLVMILNQEKSLFETDLFRPIIRKVEEIFGCSYLDNSIPFNIIADHIRALVFAIGDGAIPSNESRGYVLRRLLRRALIYAYRLGYDRPFLHNLSEMVIEIFGDIYPEIENKRRLIGLILKGEEERFLRTIAKGLDLFDSIKGNKISGEDAFLLYDSYGFPIELTKELAKERGLELDIKSFEEAMALRRAESKKTRVFNSIDLKIKKGKRTEFIGYEKDECETEVSGYALKDDEIYLLLNPTPFYPESGGQVGDQGEVEGDGFKISVLDTFYYQGMIIERGKITGSFRSGKVYARVDKKRRKEIMRAHTATHLLHRALRRVVGDWIRQEGSLVEPGRLRFDFLQFSPLTRKEIKEVEDLIYEKIVEDIEVEKTYTDFKSAVKMGAIALFGEKYGEKVRVVRIGDFSVELCGGLHLDRTGEIGTIMINREGGVAAGIRRIDAFVGLRAWEEIQNRIKIIEELKGLLGENLTGRVQQITEEIRELTAEVKTLKRKLVQHQVYHYDEINGLRFYQIKTDLDSEGMRLIADKLRNEETCLGVIYQPEGEVVTFVSPNLTNRITATEMIKVLKSKAGGGGGGREDLAQGGGIDVKKIEEAERALKDYIKTRL